MKILIFLLLNATLLAAGFLSASSATREDFIEAARKEREVVISTTTNLAEAGVMARQFKAKYPFLEVNINRAEGERIVTRVLQERYDDLLGPFWKNKMILEKDKIDWFTAILQIMGREKGVRYMRELSRQTPMLRIGQELITQLVAAGEASLQVNSNAVTVNRLKQKGAPIDWVAPGPLPGLMVGVGLTSQAPHPAAARLLVDFLLSKEGQQLYQSAGRLVARSDLPQDESMKVRGAQIVPVDPAWAETFDEDEKLMKEIFSY